MTQHIALSALLRRHHILCSDEPPVNRQLSTDSPEQFLVLGHLVLAQHVLERVPPRGIADHSLAVELPPVVQPNTNRLVPLAVCLCDDFLDTRLVNDPATQLLNTCTTESTTAGDL